MLIHTSYTPTSTQKPPMHSTIPSTGICPSLSPEVSERTERSKLHAFILAEYNYLKFTGTFSSLKSLPSSGSWAVKLLFSTSFNTSEMMSDD